jgi:hypothetical protein
MYHPQREPDVPLEFWQNWVVIYLPKRTVCIPQGGFLKKTNPMFPLMQYDTGFGEVLLLLT